MNGGGITDRIVSFSNAWLGHIRGGLAMANVSGSMIFAGISGTAVSEAASIGSVMIPAMKRSGYDAPFSGAITAVASTVGPIIPPSVPMIIVGTLTGCPWVNCLSRGCTRFTDGRNDGGYCVVSGT